MYWVVPRVHNACTMDRLPQQPQIGILRAAAFSAVFLVLVCFRIHADGIDLHRMWDDRCAECHGHSGDFARKYLDASSDGLAGTHHRDNLKLFMTNHYLPRSEVDAVYEMLRAQAGSAPRFRTECSGCHHSADEFVRASLSLRGGILYSQKSGNPVDLNRGRHHEMDPNDASYFSELLIRIAAETGQR